jgi:hypothetical protein
MQTDFRIIIDGKRNEAVSDEILHSQLKQLFPNNFSRISALLSTGPVPLKRLFDRQTAVKVQKRLEKIGLACRISRVAPKTTADAGKAPALQTPSGTETRHSPRVPPSEAPQAAKPAGLQDTLKAYEHEFQKRLDRFERDSGYKGQKSFADSAMAMAGLLAGGFVWWHTKWYWGLLACIGSSMLVQALLGGSTAKLAHTSAHYFARELDRHPKSKDPLLWVALENWLASRRIPDSEDKSIQENLQSQVRSRLDAFDKTQLEKARDQISELDRRRKQEEKMRKQVESGQKQAQKGNQPAEPKGINTQKAAKKQKDREERAANKAKSKERRSAGIRRIDANACLPVEGHQIKFHPSVGTHSLAGGFRFSVSQDTFYMIPGKRYQAAMKFPLHCIQKVEIGPASQGLSVDALVARSLGAVFKKNPMRVYVKFNLMIPIKINRGFMSHWGVSFQVEDWDWPDVAQDWERFAAQSFPDACRCPVCNEFSVTGKDASFMEKMGFKEGQIRAECGSCRKKLVFLPQSGEFQPIA